MTNNFNPYVSWFGIGLHDQPVDYYGLLGIQRFEADSALIANAANQRVQILRSVQTEANTAICQRVYNEVAAARACLIQPETKAEYDRRLMEHLSNAGGRHGTNVMPVAAAQNSTQPAPGLTSANPPLRRAIALPEKTPAVSAPSVNIGTPIVTPSAVPNKVAKPSFFTSKAFVAVAIFLGGFLGCLSGGVFAVITSMREEPAVTKRESQTELAMKTETKPQIAAASVETPPTPPLPPVVEPRKPAVPTDAPENPFFPELNSKVKTSAPSEPEESPPLPNVTPPTSVSPMSTTPTTPPMPTPASKPTPAPPAPPTSTPLVNPFDPPETAAPATSSPPVNPFDPPAAAVAPKPAPPDNDARIAIRKEVRDLFKKEYSSVKQVAEKQAFAKQLARAAMESGDDQKTRYVLLEEALALQIEIGDLTSAYEVIKTLDDKYAIDPWKMRLSTVNKMGDATKTLPERKKYLDALLNLTDDAAAASRLEIAVESILAANVVVGRMSDADLKKQVAQRKKEIDEAKKSSEIAELARNRLKTDPDNKKANLALGRFLCFQRGEWEEGLPLLAKGDDEKLKEGATKELAKPKDGAGLEDVANAWYSASASLSGVENFVLLERSQEFYKTALRESTAFAKLRVEKRIEDIDKQLQTVNVTANSKASGRPYRPHPALGYKLERHPKDAVQFGKHWYKFIPIRDSWDNSQQQCKALGGYLVCIETPEENAFILNVIKSVDRADVVWLGASKDSKGEWHWLNGSPITYFNWAQGEPNNFFGRENRMAYHSFPLGWNDLDNGSNKSKGFICEWEF